VALSGGVSGAGLRGNDWRISGGRGSGGNNRTTTGDGGEWGRWDGNSRERTGGKECKRGGEKKGKEKKCSLSFM
jgi:hypothetical protein